MATAQRRGLTHVEVRALNALSEVSLAQGDLSSTRRYEEQSLDVARRSGNPALVAMGLVAVSWSELLAGELDAADAHGHEMLALAATPGRNLPQYEGLIRHTLGLVELLRGNYEMARTELAFSLEAAIRNVDRSTRLLTLHGLAAVMAGTGRERDTALLAGASHLESADDEADSGVLGFDEACLALYSELLVKAREALGEEDWVSGLREGAEMVPEDADAYALSLAESAALPGRDP